MSSGSRKQRFIAGAVCPECREIDRIVVRETAAGREQACVACGYQKLEASASAEGGLQALVPRGKHEKPALSTSADPVEVQQAEQVVRIVDPSANRATKKTD